MSINEGTYGEFANELQDEDQLDAHPYPGIEIGYDTQRDCGSGSYAEDGPREVREDRPTMNGENPMIGSAAMYGPTEIGGIEDEDAMGAVKRAVAKATQAVKRAAVAVKRAPAAVAAKHVAAAKRATDAAELAVAYGPYAVSGATEIGEGLYSEDGGSEIGFGGFDDELGALAARSGSPEMKYLEHIDQVVTDMAQRCYPSTAAAHGAAIGPMLATGPTTAARRGSRGMAQRAQGSVNVLGSHYPTQGAAELGAGLASQEGQTEIGAGEDTLGDDSLMQPFESFMMGPERIGDDDDELGCEMGAAAAHGMAIGPMLASGPTAAARRGSRRWSQWVGEDDEMGAAAAADRPGYEIGAGLYPVDGSSEIGEGWAAADGQSEIGAGYYPGEGASEIGAEYPTNGLSEMGAGWYAEDGASEIGKKAAVVKVVEKARDNRQPAPPMKAVDVDAPLDEDEDSFLSDIVVGATVAAPGAVEPFPLLSQLLLRAGANVEPRIVRVDTEESYKQFRTDQSPALSEVRALAAKLEAHIADPNAHELDSEDIDDDISDLVLLGEEAQANEAQKRVDLWMPKRFDGKVEAWKQGDTVCVSMALPGRDGNVRICTSIEPMRKCIEEMCRHAGEAQVGEDVADVLPEMGCVLGAGTVMKEMAAAAPAILARPEAQVKLPFVVRIEPKTSPNLAALVMLAAGARQGNVQAQSEWSKLASLSAPAVKSAMLEAAAVAKSATEG